MKSNQAERKQSLPAFDAEDVLTYHASLYSPKYAKKILRLEEDRERYIEDGNIQEALNTNSIIQIYRNLSKDLKSHPNVRKTIF